MKKHARFLSVFEYVFNSDPVDPIQVEVLVAEALKNLPKKVGVKRQSFRRDVVIAHGFKGEGAQASLSREMWDFWTGENKDLLVRFSDEYRKELLDFKNSKSGPKKVRSFRDWFESQNQHKLLTGMAKSLQRRYPMEEFDECLSMVGMCVAYWLNEGNLDAKIEEKGDMSVTLLNGWIRRRHLNEIHSRGTEPLFRMRGARTNTEKTSIWRDGNKTGMAEEAVQSGGWATAIAENDSEDEFEFEVICQNKTPEESIIDANSLQVLKGVNTSVVEACYPGAADRYVSVLRILEEGGDRVTIAEEHGISVARGGHLACRIRNAIKCSIDNAPKVLEAIQNEPWITREELMGELGMKKKDLNVTLAYLLKNGGIKEINGSLRVSGN
jgi:hypothetical protein